VVGGLLISQVLTLFITPVIFTQVEWMSRKLRRQKQSPAAAVPAE